MTTVSKLGNINPTESLSVATVVFLRSFSRRSWRVVRGGIKRVEQANCLVNHCTPGIEMPKIDSRPKASANGRTKQKLKYVLSTKIRRRT